MTALQEYLKQMLERHPGVSMRQASLLAGLNENALQQILKSTHFTPRPDTLKALTDKWGTVEDYIVLMRLAGFEMPETVDIEELSAAKKRVVELLSKDEVPDELASFIVAGLETYIQQMESAI